MQVRVLFFGAVAEIAGRREMEIEADRKLVASEFLESVVRVIPDLAGHKLYMSRNQEHAIGHEIVSDGDEIGVFTSVSGG